MKKGEARVLKVKTFRNRPFGKVRTVAIEDKRWLLLEDVCTMMGFLYDHRCSPPCASLHPRKHLIVCSSRCL